MAGPPPQVPEGTGIWYALWTATKLLLVLIIAAVVAILMLTSSQPTVSPAASVGATSTRLPGTPTPGPTPTAVPTPRSAPADAVVPGRLIYIQGSTLFMVHQYDPPRELAAAARLPAGSPDGVHLSFVRFHKDFQDLYTLDLATGKTLQITQGDAGISQNGGDVRYGLSVGASSWSRDGRSLYFSWTYPGFANGNTTDFAIYDCASNGPCDSGSATQITKPDQQTGGDYEPAVRPLDPNTLVYTGYSYLTFTSDQIPRSVGQIVAHDLSSAGTSGNEVTLTPIDQAKDAPESLSQPAWNPTGRYLAFVKTTQDGQQSSIYVMAFHPPGNAADYSHAHLLVRGGPFATQPVFSPDGHYLAYLRTADDGRLHLFIAHVRLGARAAIDHEQMVARAGIVDGDRLVWLR